jgi:hypothetical protein
VWAEAAKWLGKFDEAVLTVLDADGYPVSVRVGALTYDAATGKLPAALPDVLRAVEGPANLLCRYHDEKMWKLKAIQVRGRLEKRNGEWDFVSTSFMRRPNWRCYRFSRTYGPLPRNTWTSVGSSAQR